MAEFNLDDLVNDLKSEGPQSKEFLALMTLTHKAHTVVDLFKVNSELIRALPGNSPLIIDLCTFIRNLHTVSKIMLDQFDYMLIDLTGLADEGKDKNEEN